MSGAGWILFFAMLIGCPLAGILWFCTSWSKFKSTVPFTPEHGKRKVMMIISAVFAGITLGAFLTIMAIYGVTVFFA